MQETYRAEVKEKVEMEKTQLRDLACEPTPTLYVTNNLKGIKINANNLVI